MTMRRPTTVVCGLLVLTAASCLCKADVLNMPFGQKSLELVTVGNPGNAPFGATIPYGAVPYTYEIGKYDVTAGQYCQFLNAVAKTDTYDLYNPGMWSNEEGCKIQRTAGPSGYIYTVAADRANRPVTHVSRWDACRFVNWLSHGQPNGLQDASTTEDGSYAVNGYTGSYGGNIMRKPDAAWVIPSLDEWFKAAYHKNDGVTGNYWYYPTQSNSAPVAEAPPGRPSPPGSMNCMIGGTLAVGAPYYTTEVGAYTSSPGPYGTFDQGGNVYQWLDTLKLTDAYGTGWALQGGSYSREASYAFVTSVGIGTPSAEVSELGFRVAYVPEPATLSLLALGGLLLAHRRRA